MCYDIYLLPFPSSHRVQFFTEFTRKCIISEKLDFRIIPLWQGILFLALKSTKKYVKLRKCLSLRLKKSTLPVFGNSKLLIL